MTLEKIRRGQRVSVRSIMDEAARLQALRFGIGEGAEILCDEIIPGGPIIVSNHGQQIAIGRGLARRIVVGGEN